MAHYSTLHISEIWRKWKAPKRIHGLSSSLKSLPLLTGSMLWFIPKTKHYKNNVSSTEYHQLLSALAAVKERYMLLKAGELTQLSVEAAMLGQIFHPSPRLCSSTSQESTQLICPMQDVCKRKGTISAAPSCSCLWQAGLRGITEVTVSMHWHTRGKLCFSSASNGAHFNWMHLSRKWSCSSYTREAVTVLWEAPENVSTTHPEQLPGKGSSDMNTHTCMQTHS